MAASGLIRRSEPQPTAQVRTWPRTAAILDEDGQPLTSVDVLGPPRDGRLQFGDVWEPAALLDQYFGRGAEIVMVSLDACVIVGRLATRWEGDHRNWWLEVDDWSPAP